MTKKHDEDEQLSLLLWLTGCSDVPVSCMSLGDEAFLTLIRQHRIAGRALQTLRREKPAWASVALLQALEERHQHLINQAAKHIDVIAAFVRDFNTDKKPIVILKGLTAYAHSRDLHHIRESNDVDFIMLSPTETIRTIKAQQLKEFRKVSPHELLNVTVMGIEMDLHAFYPVWYFLNDDAQQIPKIIDGNTFIKHGRALQVGQFRVEDIIFNALEDTYTGEENVFYPDAAAAAIILCAHAHRDFISKSSVTARKKPPIRFSEIAELIDYFRSKDFNFSRFLNIVNKTNAITCVSWMCEMVRKTTGINLLPEGLLINHEKNLPDFLYQQLVWSGFLKVFDRKNNAVFFRHLTTEESVNALGFTPLNMQSAQAFIDVKHKKVSTSAPHQGAVLHVRSEGWPEVCVNFSLKKNHLVVRLVITSPSDCISRRLYIDIFNQPLEFQAQADGCYYKKSLHFPVHHFDYEVTDSAYSCYLTIPLPDKTSTVSLIIAAGEFEDAYSLRRGILLPVKLLF